MSEQSTSVSSVKMLKAELELKLGGVGGLMRGGGR